MALVQVRKVGQLGEPTENAIISTFRVYILLFTMIAILAVDFNVFPTHFGKTHGYGVSVMDIGVGAFVASNALACSDAKSTTVPLSVVSIVTKALPLLVVGFVRWASTAAISYHVDPTEYGIHWNFFFSLFVVRVAGELLGDLTSFGGSAAADDLPKLVNFPNRMKSVLKSTFSANFDSNIPLHAATTSRPGDNSSL